MQESREGNDRLLGRALGFGDVRNLDPLPRKAAAIKKKISLSTSLWAANGKAIPQCAPYESTRIRGFVLLWSDSFLPCAPHVTSMTFSDYFSHTQVSSLSSEETLRALHAGLTDMTKGLWGQWSV